MTTVCQATNIQDKVSRYTLPQLVRFAFVGVLNTLSAVVVIYSLMALGIAPYAANFAGYSIALLLSFTLNRRWTFRSRQQLGSRLVAKFAIAVVGAYLANLLTVYACVGLGISLYLAQLAGMPAYTICFYLGSKFFVFNDKSDHSDNLV